MLSFPGSLKIVIALDPIDLRAGINTLSALVAERIKETAQSGALTRVAFLSRLDGNKLGIWG